MLNTRDAWALGIVVTAFGWLGARVWAQTAAPPAASCTHKPSFVQSLEGACMNGDATEAEAWAYLAVRSKLGASTCVEAIMAWSK